jgi:hypothetical protein
MRWEMESEKVVKMIVDGRTEEMLTMLECSKDVAYIIVALIQKEEEY